MLFIIGLTIGANYYVVYRLIGIIPSTILKIALAVFAVGILFCFPLGFFLRKHGFSKIISRIFTVGLTWFISCIYLLISFIILEFVRIGGINLFTPSWITLGILVLVISILLIIGNYVYRKKSRVELNLNMNLKAPIKIVALSDLHLGHRITRKEFESWIPLINQENPDIVLFAGDIIDIDPQPLFEQDFASAFHSIKSRYGLYAVLGNHEYISGLSESLRFYKAANLKLLRDTSTLIDNQFYLIGRDDYFNPKRKSTKELLSDLDSTKPTILLDHQPHHLDEAEKNGIDLQISGHTHYGQFWPISQITNLLFEKAYGYLKKGNTHFYISSGMGIWGGKYRIGTRSEYVVINLNFPK